MVENALVQLCVVICVVLLFGGVLDTCIKGYSVGRILTLRIVTIFQPHLDGKAILEPLLLVPLLMRSINFLFTQLHHILLKVWMEPELEGRMTAIGMIDIVEKLDNDVFAHRGDA